MSLWDKPDLSRLRGQILDFGKRCQPIRGNSFRCQCPAHDGQGDSAMFKLQPSGKISFTCYSHDCSLKDLMDAMDLVSADFYPDTLNPLKRRVYEPSQDQALVVVAQNDVAKGKRLSRKEHDQLREAMLRLGSRNAMV